MKLHLIVENDIRAKNIETIRQNLNKEISEYIIKEVPQYIISEIGLTKVLDFLIVEDGTNFRFWTAMAEPKQFRDKQRHEEEDEISFLQRKNEIEDIHEIKSRLVYYFLRRLVANVPVNKELTSRDDVFNFIKTYEQAFIHGYVLPMASHK